MKQNLSFLVFCLFLIGSAYGQNARITGKVTSADDGSPLGGVSVIVRGTSSGTQTDNEGNYSVEVREGASTLLFRMVGYAEQDVPINGQGTINVSLEVDASVLSEVIVTGYGQ